MTHFKTTLLALTLTLFPHASALCETADAATLKQEATAFFHTYLGTYNKRLAEPESEQAFLDELRSLINTPFIMAPPSANAPFYPESEEMFARGFGGFVKQLERKGAVRMEWQEINVEVLTPNKVLANNIGHAFNASGDVVYETISLYLLHRSDSGWKIAVFSPYDVANKLVFKKG
ncbi:MAG: hypothetical protein AAFN78_07340 [Pseudomonadota bacterium]